MNMDIVNKWLTLASNLGVLAGIIFLAIEINQNNDQLKNQTNQKYIDIRLSNTQDLFGDESIAEIFFKATNGAELTEFEQFKLHRFYNMTFIGWGWEFDQYQLGYHENFPATQIRNTYISWPGMREYRNSIDRPDSAFNQFMENGILNP